MNPDKTFVTKLGTTRAGERTRIWLEGSRLVAHGFTCGHMFLKTWEDGRLILTLHTGGALTAGRSSLGTVSGKGDKPIIDITGARVAELFGTGTHVTVTYRAGRITITTQEA
jgi:hypothetical protein